MEARPHAGGELILAGEEGALEATRVVAQTNLSQRQNGGDNEEERRAESKGNSVRENQSAGRRRHSDSCEKPARKFECSLGSCVLKCAVGLKRGQQLV